MGCLTIEKGLALLGVTDQALMRPKSARFRWTDTQY